MTCRTWRRRCPNACRDLQNAGASTRARRPREPARLRRDLGADHVGPRLHESPIPRRHSRAWARAGATDPDPGKPRHERAGGRQEPQARLHEPPVAGNAGRHGGRSGSAVRAERRGPAERIDRSASRHVGQAHCAAAFRPGKPSPSRGHQGREEAAGAAKPEEGATTESTEKKPEVTEEKKEEKS